MFRFARATTRECLFDNNKSNEPRAQRQSNSEMTFSPDLVDSRSFGVSRSAVFDLLVTKDQEPRSHEGDLKK